MAKINDKDGIREINSVSVKGASYGVGANSKVGAAGLTAQVRSFTNYNANHAVAVFDCNNTTAAVNAKEIARIYTVLYSAGVVQNMVYNGTNSETL